MILLVDNEKSRMQVYIEELEIAGYQVELKTDIDSALQYWHENQDKIDLLILDIMMPSGKLSGEPKINGGLRTGIVFYQKVRENNQNVPIIFLTNVSKISDPELEKEIVNNPKSKFLQKLETLPSQLIEEVNQMLKS